MAETKLEIVIDAVNRSASELKNVQADMERLKGSTDGAGFSVGKLAEGFALGEVALQAAEKGFELLKETVTESIAKAGEMQHTVAILSGELENLGKKAPITTKGAMDLAKSMESVTSYSKETVLQAETLEAKFQGIGQKTFPEVLKAAGDLATTMGGDLVGATSAISRAMVDPTRGLMLLERQSRAFTAAQMEQVKHMAAVGDMAGYQKAILEALGNKYQGLADREANTFEGRMKSMHNAISDVEENIGKALLPGLENLVGSFTKTIKSAGDATEGTDNLSETFFKATGFIEAVITVIGGLIKLLFDLGKEAIDTGKFIIDAFKDGYEAVQEFGKSMGNVVDAVGKMLRGDFKGAADEMHNSFKFNFDATLADLNNVGKDIGAQVDDVTSTFKTAAGQISDAMNLKGYQPIKDGNADAVNAINGSGEDDPNTIGGASAKQAAKAQKEAEKIQKAVDEMGTKFQDVHDKMASYAEDFQTRAETAYNAYEQKVADIQAKISDLTQTYTEQQASIQQSGQDAQIKAYENYQKQLETLKVKEQDLMLKTSDGQNNKNLDKDLVDLKKTQETIATIQTALDKHKELVAAVAKDQNTDDITKAQDKENEALAKAKESYQKKYDALQESIKKENDAYQAQREKLIADTQKKYEALDKEVDTGYKKIEATLQGHLAQMQAIEAQMTAIKSAIGMAESSTIGSINNPVPKTKLAAGGVVTKPTVALIGEDGPEAVVPLKDNKDFLGQGGIQTANIHIMEGANVTIQNEADEKRLTETIARELARVLQSQRMGLATRY